MRKPPGLEKQYYSTPEILSKRSYYEMYEQGKKLRIREGKNINQKLEELSVALCLLIGVYAPLDNVFI